jgi:hypothetical protein
MKLIRYTMHCAFGIMLFGLPFIIILHLWNSSRLVLVGKVSNMSQRLSY